MRLWLLRFFSFLVLGIFVAAGYIIYEGYRFMHTPGSGEPKDIIISIAPGSTFDRVARDLKEAGAIRDVDRFRILARMENAEGRIKAGEFLINTGWTPERVLHQITEGQAILYRLFVREGLTWWDTARTIEAQGFALYEGLLLGGMFRTEDIELDCAKVKQRF